MRREKGFAPKKGKTNSFMENEDQIINAFELIEKAAKWRWRVKITTDSSQTWTVVFTQGYSRSFWGKSQTFSKAVTEAFLSLSHAGMIE